MTTDDDTIKRIAELEAERDDALFIADNRESMCANLREDLREMQGHLQKMEAERDALKADAERYIKLVNSRRYCPDPFGNGWAMVLGHRRNHSKTELDAAIDAAKG